MRMTKQELINRQQAMIRNSNRWAVLFLVILFGFLLANIPLSRIMDTEQPSMWIQILYGIIFFCFPIGYLVSVFWFLRRQQRTFGLQCPNCNKPLIGVTGQIAVATGACGHCGKTVVRDGEYSN